MLLLLILMKLMLLKCLILNQKYFFWFRSIRSYARKNVEVMIPLKYLNRKFTLTDTKLYVSVGTLSIQDNAKLLQEFKSNFKRKIIRNKYQRKVSTERPMQYLDYLTDPYFKAVNRPFYFLFEDNAHWTSHRQYFLPNIFTMLWFMYKMFLINQ